MTRNYRNSSIECASCRIEWCKGRLSRVLPWSAFALATVATCVSGLDIALKGVLSLIWLFEALRAHQAMSGWHTGVLQWDKNESGLQIRVRGGRVSGFRLNMRGQWVLLAWRDAAMRRKSLLLCPGDLSAAALRELRSLRDTGVDAVHTPLLST